MPQAVLRIEDLPESALDAAARFHGEWLPQARSQLGAAGSLALIFPVAVHEHRGWRLAVVQELAREAATKRVNGIAGDDQAAIDQATEWLASAPGITGQLLDVA